MMVLWVAPAGARACRPASAPNEPCVAMSYLVGYNRPVIDIRETDAYNLWFRKLRDSGAIADPHPHPPIVAGQSGRCAAGRRRISELRIDYGPGYRVYFSRVDTTTAVLLPGGDIERARVLAQELLKDEDP